MLVEGKQQWLFDESGRRYLDVSHPLHRPLPCVVTEIRYNGNSVGLIDAYAGHCVGGSKS